MLTFTERLPDTKSAKSCGYTFTRCDAHCGCDAKIVYSAKGKRAEYAVTEFPCALSGRAFRMEKIGGDIYDVFISDRSRREDICDCPGATRYGVCKHLEMARDVIAYNLLPSPLCNEDADSYSMELAD